MSYEGVHEEGGDNCGPQIEEFQKAVDGRASREAWCICFLQYCGKKAAEESGARWGLFPSEGALLVWEKSPLVLRRTAPAPGLIALWQKTGTRLGHGGLVIEADGRDFQTIEGNTSLNSHQERNGDGVYRKNLSMPGTRGNLQLLGFLEPFL